MGFITTLIIISMFISLCIYLAEDPRCYGEKAMAYAFMSMFVCTVASVVICTAIFATSYGHYVGLMKRAVTIEQEAAAVHAYAGYGVGSFVMGQMASDEVTDFKFGDYQKEMSRKINKLRTEVKNYNNALVGKEVMNDGWYWSWLIYLPDTHLEVVSMDELIKSLSKPEVPETAVAPTTKDEPKEGI